MKKLLIAVNSTIVSDDLYKQLEGRYDIICLHNGTDAIGVLNTFHPDIVVIDVMLSGLDGITVLNAANAAGIFPQVIALTDFLSNYISNALEQLNVSSLFRYGSDMRAVVARIVEMEEMSQDADSVQLEIRKLLAFLGFHMNTVGTAITELAVATYIEHPGQVLSSALYPQVASIWGGTTTQVERAIRISIARAWKNRNDDIWQLYFATGKNGTVSRPSNADFLARASSCIANMGRTMQTVQKRKIG